MDEIINNFLELKKWEKMMLLVMIALMCSGCIVAVVGIVIGMPVVVPILGAVMVLCGAGVYIFARNVVKKTKKTILDYLQTSNLPQEQIIEIMEKIKP